MYRRASYAPLPATLMTGEARLALKLPSYPFDEQKARALLPGWRLSDHVAESRPCAFCAGFGEKARRSSIIAGM